MLASSLSSRPLLPAALGTAVVAFGSPGPFLLGHPQVYELAIVAAQAFLLGGLLFAALGREARGGWRTLCDLACAACWTLAVASRQTVVFAVVALWLLTCFGWRARTGRLPIARMLVFATPALLGMLMLGAYNQARFGSPLETGPPLPARPPGDDRVPSTWRRTPTRICCGRPARSSASRS